MQIDWEATEDGMVSIAKNCISKEFSPLLHQLTDTFILWHQSAEDCISIGPGDL